MSKISLSTRKIIITNSNLPYILDNVMGLPTYSITDNNTDTAEGTYLFRIKKFTSL